MFSELEKVMSFSMESSQYLDAMADNVFGKKSSDGVKQTKGYLKRLYGFDSQYPPFAAFMYFWKMSEPNEKPLIAFLYALNQDNLLAESVQVLQNVKPGTKVAVEYFEEIVEKYHPNQYAIITKHSIGKNLASSWKQAGFIEGKVKNIRIQPEITYRTACFAFLLAYLNGDRGDFIWNNIGVNALCLHESKLRALAIECAKNDLMQYQYAGSVTAINFTNLLIKMGIHGNSN